VLDYECPLAEKNPKSLKNLDIKVETLDLACILTKNQSPKIT